MTDAISFSDFQKLDIRVGTVTEASVPEWFHERTPSRRQNQVGTQSPTSIIFTAPTCPCPSAGGDRQSPTRIVEIA